MLNDIKNWLIVIRPFGFTGTIVPTILGASLAYNNNYFNIKLLFITLISFLLIHTGTNLINDYYDFKNGIDSKGSLSSSGLMQVKGKIRPKYIKIVGILSFLSSIPLLIFLAYLRGLPTLIIGIIGICAGYFYTAPPINYKYYGLGPLLVFIFMGPVMVCASYYIQTGNYSWTPFWVSLPVAVLIAGVLYSNELRDLENDKNYNLISIPILLGFERAKYIYYSIIVSVYILLSLLIWKQYIPSGEIILFLTIIPAGKLLLKVSRTEKPLELRKIDKNMASLHLGFGGLLSLIIIIDKLI